MPIDILLEPEMFTEKNGLLTSALKLCRPNLEKKYRLRLEDLYRQSQFAAVGRSVCNYSSLSNVQLVGDDFTFKIKMYK